jgi:hypothetical protein
LFVRAIETGNARAPRELAARYVEDVYRANPREYDILPKSMHREVSDM